jgi:hypothetical protein
VRRVLDPAAPAPGRWQSQRYQPRSTPRVV